MPKDHPCQVWFKLVEQFLQILIKKVRTTNVNRTIQKGHSAFWPGVLNCNRNQYNHTNIRKWLISSVWCRKINCISSALQKLEAQWAEPVSLTFHSAFRKLNTNTEPSIGASHQISIHLAKQFQRRRFF